MFKDEKNHIIHLTRQEVEDAILGNLIMAGVLMPSECLRYLQVIQDYDPQTLLKTLIYSHQLKEARGESECYLKEFIDHQETLEDIDQFPSGKKY